MNEPTHIKDIIPPKEMLRKFIADNNQEIKDREEALYLKDWQEAVEEDKRRAITPLDTILNEMEAWDRQSDLAYLAYCKEQAGIFNKLYLKNFANPLFRKINRAIIIDIRKEMEALNAKLFGHKASKRDIRYRLAGNPEAPGQAGN